MKSTRTENLTEHYQVLMEDFAVDIVDKDCPRQLPGAISCSMFATQNSSLDPGVLIVAEIVALWQWVSRCWDAASIMIKILPQMELPHVKGVFSISLDYTPRIRNLVFFSLTWLLEVGYSFWLFTTHIKIYPLFFLVKNLCLDDLMVNNKFYNKSAQNCYKLSFTPFHIKLFDVYPHMMAFITEIFW